MLLNDHILLVCFITSGTNIFVTMHRKDKAVGNLCLFIARTTRLSYVLEFLRLKS